MNLIKDPWIPVRLADGSSHLIRPAEIVLAENTPRAIDSPRADFDGALAQFLIGLLQTAFAPPDDDTWIDRLEQPPSVAELDQAFAPYAQAFELGGEGPRFMQDPSVMDEKYDHRSIDRLLIETNETHFNKPGRIQHLCPGCAGTALFTLQINAPEGGRGHYTSIRGGGPLTTLLKLDDSNEINATLWDHIWLNILPIAQFVTDDSSAIFPWLAPERFIKARTGTFIYPEDIPFAHYYWGMPRRIWLQADSKPNQSCDLCGTTIDIAYTGYRTRPNGIHYAKEPVWNHPLSPHRLQGKTKDLQVEHPHPGGLSYRYWLGYVMGNNEEQEAVVNARNVRHFLTQRNADEQCIVWAFGYDMKSNKARCWYETTLPLYRVPEPIRRCFEQRVEQLIRGANTVASMLRTAVKEAWFKRPGDARGDTGFLADGFYQHTEADFYARLPRLIESIPEGKDRSVLTEWHQILQGAALTLFDEWAASGDLAFADPARIARAHDKLIRQLNGKKLKNLLSLPTTQEKVA